MRVDIAHWFLLSFGFLLLNEFKFVNSWQSYELDLFDLVEEIGQNFYEFFGVNQVSE